MKDCKTCENRIFDEQWGEHKCTVYKHRIYDVDKYIDCPSHKSKNTKGEEKTNV